MMPVHIHPDELHEATPMTSLWRPSLSKATLARHGRFIEMLLAAATSPPG